MQQNGKNDELLLNLKIGFLCFFLRIVRAIFGVVFASEFIYIIEAIVTLIMNSGDSTVDSGKFFAVLLSKLVVLVGSGFAFFYLRKLINDLHEKSMVSRIHPWQPKSGTFN